MSVPRRTRSPAALATLGLSTACGSSETEPLVPATISLATLPAATARIADTTHVVVRVLTAAARPVAGQVVGFTLDGPGTGTQPSATTDARGGASTTWVLGTTVGLQQLVARAGTLAPLTIAANVAAAGTGVAQPPSLLVREPNAGIARSEIAVMGHPAPVVQALANGDVGPAILRATLPDGWRYDLPFNIVPPPKPRRALGAFSGHR